MAEKKDPIDKFDVLRKRAEVLVKHQTYDTPEKAPDILDLIHELRIHQAELEIQNEELKRAQQELSDLYRKYVDLYEFAPCGYITLNNKGIITNSNLTGARILGSHREYTRRKGMSQFIDSDWEDVFIAARAKCSETGERQSVELPLKRKNEKSLWVRLEIEADRDEKGVAHQWRVILIDISNQKKAEKALSQSERRFLELADNIREVFWLFDWENQKVIYVSPAFAEIWGYSIESLYEQYEIWAESIHPDDLEIAKSSFKKIFETGGGEHREYRIIRSDGAIRWISDRGFAIRDDDGNIVRIAGIAEDITDRKKAEKQRLEMQIHLQQSTKMDAIATLAGGVAHQFNNALYVVVGNLELLEMSLPPDKNIKKYINQMKDSTSRMARLTSQLLAYAQGGKYEEKVVPFSSFVRDTLRLIEHTIKPPAYLEMDLPHEIHSVKADLTQMQMAILAILTNATEAIGSTGGIKVICRNQKVTSEMHNMHPEIISDHYVRLSIGDNGCGMDEETINRVFEPFFTTKFQGRGLGMAAAYGIVTNHNGWILLDSELGKGTTVTVYLPGFTETREEKTDQEIEAVQRSGTVLLIEDETMVLEVSRAFFEKLGYHILEAKTGQEAIHLAKNFSGKIDIVLLDIVLPDIGGKELYPIIAEDRPDAKVIVCSGYSIDGPAQEIINAGAHGFLQKPFNYKELANMLNEVL